MSTYKSSILGQNKKMLPPTKQGSKTPRKKRQLRAGFNASDVLQLDESILRALVLDETGNVLSKATRPKFRKKFTVPGTFKDKAGIISIVALRIAQEVAKHMGPLQSMVYVYKDSKVIGIPIPKFSCEVIAITTRGMDAGYITDKVTELAIRS
ncbi:MAG: hypothetical protein ACYC7D_02265 [Nitrososphaerales archaeon]